MNKREFVNVIKRLIYDGGLREIKKILNKPSGRKPPERLVKMSKAELFHSRITRPE